MVIIEDVTITLLELNILINTKGLLNARERKLSKENYITFLGDLQSKGFIEELETMEVGSLGHFSSTSIHSIHAILSHIKCRSVYVICCSPSQKRLCSQAPKLFLTATTSMNGVHPHYYGLATASPYVPINVLALSRRYHRWEQMLASKSTQSSLKGLPKSTVVMATYSNYFKGANLKWPKIRIVHLLLSSTSLAL